jgi:phosphonate transport system substrate-binding protein
MPLAVSAHLSDPQNELFMAKLDALELDYALSGASPDVTYLCGLPASHLLSDYELLAAPSLPGERYQGRPWYFVDVVARTKDAPEKTWAFNQKDSFSGWLAIQHGFMVERRSPSDVAWLETGSHRASLEAVRSGRADRAGIDSSMVDLVPDLLEGLEVVTTWGPWPAPPVLVARTLDEVLRAQLRAGFESEVGGRWLSLDSGHLAPIIAVEAGMKASHAT